MTAHPAPAPERVTAWVTASDGIDQLRPTAVAVPEPGPTDVPVEVAAVSLNYRDLMGLNGVGGLRPASPVSPVASAVGLVVAVGDQVTGLQRDHRVLPSFLPKWHDGALIPKNDGSPVGGPVSGGVLAEHLVVGQDDAVHAPTHALRRRVSHAQTLGPSAPFVAGQRRAAFPDRLVRCLTARGPQPLVSQMEPAHASICPRASMDPDPRRSGARQRRGSRRDPHRGC